MTPQPRIEYPGALPRDLARDRANELYGTGLFELPVEVEAGVRRCGLGPEPGPDLVADLDGPFSHEVALHDRADTVDLHVDLVIGAGDLEASSAAFDVSVSVDISARILDLRPAHRLVAIGTIRPGRKPLRAFSLAGGAFLVDAAGGRQAPPGELLEVGGELTVRVEVRPLFAEAGDVEDPGVARHVDLRGSDLRNRDLAHHDLLSGLLENRARHVASHTRV